MYNTVREKILSTLLGRPEGTEVQVSNHQDYALNLLEYVRRVEIAQQSVLIDVANEDTEPIKPNSSRVTYIAGIPVGETVVFYNFLDEEGEPITVSSTTESLFVLLLWNCSYWSAYSFPISLIYNQIDFLENTDQSLIYIKKNLTKIGIIGTLYCSGALVTIEDLNETSLFSSVGFSPNSSRIIRANDLTVGSLIRMKLTGIFTTLLGATANLKIKIDGITLIDVLETFDNNREDYYFEKEITLNVRAIGSTGSLICQGRSLVQDGAAGQTLLIPIKQTAPVAFNSEIDNLLDITFKWNSSGNSLKVSTSTIEILS